MVHIHNSRIKRLMNTAFPSELVRRIAVRDNWRHMTQKHEPSGFTYSTNSDGYTKPRDRLHYNEPFFRGKRLYSGGLAAQSQIDKMKDFSKSVHCSSTKKKHAFW